MGIDFPSRPQAKESLLRFIRGYRAALDAVVYGLPEDAYVQQLGEWSIKDQLAHVAAWEGAAMSALRGLRWHEGLELPSLPADLRDYEAMNRLLHAQWRDVSLAGVIERYQSRHAALLDALEAAAQADLDAPYADPRAREDLSVGHVVAANTYEHYIEHATWIGEQLAVRPS